MFSIAKKHAVTIKGYKLGCKQAFSSVWFVSEHDVKVVTEPTDN
jgi:hypothetical protein